MNGDSIQRGLLLALLAFLQPSLKADSIPEIVAKAKPAIVEIVTTFGHQRNYDKAVSDYDEAIRLDPHYAPSYLNRGLEYRNKGNWQKAISDLTEAIRLDPNNADAYKNRGSTYLRAGDSDKAYADFAAVGRLKSRPIKDVDLPPK